MRSTPGRFVLANLIALFAPVAASGQAPALVEVAAGDRIHGDVRRLERGRLAFRTATHSLPGAQRWGGTVAIVWTEVVRLESEQVLEVELSSGERHAGTVSSPSSGRLVVETASGATSPLALHDIVSIIPLEAGFRARTTGTLDVGFSLASAQDTRTYTLNGQAQHRSRGYTYDTRLALNSWLSARDGTETLTRNDLGVDVRRRLGSRWYAVVAGRVQQDEPLELDTRLLVGGGVGRALVRSQRLVVSVHGGLAYDAENYAGADTSHAAEAVAALDLDWFAPGSATEAMLDTTTFISLARARARLEVDGSIRRDFVWDLYWALNVFERFDGDPPGDRPRSDLGLSFTLGWVF